MKLAHCKCCGKEKGKKWGRDTLGRGRMFDELGQRWEGRTCYDCTLSKMRDRRHAIGIDRFKNPIPIHKKGIQSELVVRELFERNGYTVKQSTLKGPDLVLEKGGKITTCEVKSVIKVNKSGCWYVAPVSKYRRTDDLMAMVLDGKLLHIEPMEAHLASCSPCGTRTVTNEVKYFISNSA